MAQGVECSVLECSTPRRKREWCGRHYAMWRRTGDPTTPPKWTHAPRRESCEVCGVHELMRNSRRYCSWRCLRRAERAKTDPLATARSKTCELCGTPIDLFETGKAGRKRRADVRVCSRCRLRRTYRHKFPVRVLAERDAWLCGICGERVDEAIAFPDPRSASVDHVIARADGGSDEPANLQLAHLECNHRKAARSHWTKAAA